jgi:signal transduction histidine kinase
MEKIFTELSPEFLEKINIFQDSLAFWALSVPEQRYTFISPNFEKLTGLRLSEVYLNPKLWLELIQDYDEPKHSRIISNDRIYFESSYSIQNYAGDKLKVDEILIPIFDENNQLIQIQGFSRMKKEISETKIEILEDILIPYFSYEKKNKHWKLVSASKKFLEMLENQGSSEIHPSVKNSLIKKIIEKLDEVVTNKNLKTEIEVTSEEFENIYLLEMFLQSENSGKEKVSGYAFDITELKINERRLQKLNSDKNKLLSIVSHDLKAPFNTILNFINLINDGIEIDEDQKKEYLRYIYNSAKQQLELIHDLLDWSKIEAGLLEFSPNFIDFHPIINKVLNSYSGQIYQKGIKIIQNFDKELKVFFDKNYLKIVLSNLISNAVKFSHKNGKIIISANDEDDFTTITIQDNGIGFSERYFKQLTQSNDIAIQIGTMGEKGTGLGLRFCYDIITSNYGKLFIESKSQKGTKVTIKIKKPDVVAVYFGEENEINRLKNYSSKIQPNIFLYLCSEIFDFYRFTESNHIDVAFMNLDIIKSFQTSFLEKIFSVIPDNSKKIGFSSQPDTMVELKEPLKINEIEILSNQILTIKQTLKEIYESTKSTSHN